MRLLGAVTACLVFALSVLPSWARCGGAPVFTSYDLETGAVSLVWSEGQPMWRDHAENPDFSSCWTYGCYQPPVSDQFRGYFWSLGTGDPQFGPGDDGGNLPTDLWFHTVEHEDTDYWSGGVIHGNWNIAEDGCLFNQGATESIDATECTVVMLADQVDGVGYYAVVTGIADGIGNTSFHQPNDAPIVLRPLQPPLVTNVAERSTSAGASFVGGAATTALEIEISPPAALGADSQPATTCGSVVRGYKVYEQRVPTGAPPPTDRTRTSLGESSGWARSTVVDGGMAESVAGPGSAGSPDTYVSTGLPANVEVQCDEGGDVYLAYSIVFDSGFETPYVSSNSVRIECPCDGIDADGDRVCAPPDGADCDDEDPSIYPHAPQHCDGVNRDCDDPNWPQTATTEIDNDLDGYSECDGDCDDAQARVFPGAAEVCDDLNNDCQDPNWPMLPPPEFDSDADGWTVCGGDEDDGNPLVFPGAAQDSSEAGSSSEIEGSPSASNGPAGGPAGATAGATAGGHVTLYVAQGGTGTDCTEGSPCDMDAALAKVLDACDTDSDGDCDGADGARTESFTIIVHCDADADNDGDCDTVITDTSATDVGFVNGWAYRAGKPSIYIDSIDCDEDHPCEIKSSIPGKRVVFQNDWVGAHTQYVRAGLGYYCLDSDYWSLTDVHFNSVSFPGNVKGCGYWKWANVKFIGDVMAIGRSLHNGAALVNVWLSDFGYGKDVEIAYEGNPCYYHVKVCQGGVEKFEPCGTDADCPSSECGWEGLSQGLTLSASNFLHWENLYLHHTRTGGAADGTPGGTANHLYENPFFGYSTVHGFQIHELADNMVLDNPIVAADPRCHCNGAYDGQTATGIIPGRNLCPEHGTDPFTGAKAEAEYPFAGPTTGLVWHDQAWAECDRDWAGLTDGTNQDSINEFSMATYGTWSDCGRFGRGVEFQCSDRFIVRNGSFVGHSYAHGYCSNDDSVECVSDGDCGTGTCSYVAAEAGRSSSSPMLNSPEGSCPVGFDGYKQFNSLFYDSGGFARDGRSSWLLDLMSLDVKTGENIDHEWNLYHEGPGDFTITRGSSITPGQFVTSFSEYQDIINDSGESAWYRAVGNPLIHAMQEESPQPGEPSFVDYDKHDYTPAASNSAQVDAGTPLGRCQGNPAKLCTVATQAVDCAGEGDETCDGDAIALDLTISCDNTKNPATATDPTQLCPGFRYDGSSFATSGSPFTCNASNQCEIPLCTTTDRLGNNREAAGNYACDIGPHEWVRAVPPVPDGWLNHGDPMTVDRLTANGDQIRVNWDAGTCPAVGYNLLYGNLENVAGYVFQGAECDIGETGVFTWSGVPEDDLYLLVVATDGRKTEGSWGFDGQGDERNEGTASFQCDVVVSNTSDPCNGIDDNCDGAIDALWGENADGSLWSRPTCQ